MYKIKNERYDGKETMVLVFENLSVPMTFKYYIEAREFVINFHNVMGVKGMFYSDVYDEEGIFLGTNINENKVFLAEVVYTLKISYDDISHLKNFVKQSLNLYKNDLWDNKKGFRKSNLSEVNGDKFVIFELHKDFVKYNHVDYMLGTGIEEAMEKFKTNNKYITTAQFTELCHLLNDFLRAVKSYVTNEKIA